MKRPADSVDSTSSGTLDKLPASSFINAKNLAALGDFMTRTINIDEIKNSIQAVIALTRNGDEIIVEENGEPIVKVTPIEKPEVKQRIAGLGGGKGYFMSDDFDDELPDEFWGWDKE